MIEAKIKKYFLTNTNLELFLLFDILES